MIAPVLLNAIEPVAAITPAGRDAGGGSRLLQQFEVGQLLSANVGAQLPDGSFSVEIAGQQMRMSLPAYVNSGDRLALTFVGNDPRPTFALQEQAPAADAPVLSAAGRLVAAMLPQPGAPAMVAAAGAAAPLLGALPADGTALAAALEHSLAHSGLFYEAHQAEWMGGNYDLAQLRAEPQAQFAQSAPQPTALPAGGTTADAAPIAAATATMAAAPLAQSSLQPEGSTLVQQQLAALESGRVVLQLEVWPKQWMQWEIDEHAQGAAQQPDAPASWQTRLRLDLPQLGTLIAALTLGNQGVHIKLDAISAGSAALLQKHRASLHAALAAAGVPPAIITVGHHEQP